MLSCQTVEPGSPRLCFDGTPTARHNQTACSALLAVPVDKLHPFYAGVDSWRGLPAILTEQIAHFFQHYKDLEKGKSVEIVRWADPEETGELIRQGIERAKAAGKGQPGT